MSSQLTFHLIITDLAGQKRVVEISTGVTIIGRQPGVTLRLDQTKISRQHAKIECDGIECLITDLQSANGTRLDGKVLQSMLPYRLHQGMAIEIGDFNLVYEEVHVDLPEPVGSEAFPTSPVPPNLEEELPASELPAGEIEPEEQAAPPEMAAPPGEPPSPPTGAGPVFLPGMDGNSRFFIKYLPEIYQTEFMEQFLGIFESILLPVEWNIDNFDLFLSPATAPKFFLTWLASWFDLNFDSTWTEAQRRALLAEAATLYAMRGTRSALSRLLEIYTGQKPLINDTGKELQPFSFIVRLHGKQHISNRRYIQRLIEANKPAHTTYTLEIEE